MPKVGKVSKEETKQLIELVRENAAIYMINLVQITAITCSSQMRGIAYRQKWGALFSSD